MTEWYPQIVTSNLSRTVTRDGIAVRVKIIRTEGSKDWTLGVENGADIYWCLEESFATDAEAYAEFERVAAEEGMQTFIDNGNVNPGIEPDPEFVASNLSQTVTRDGIIVSVEISRMEGTTDWFLRVYNDEGECTHWSELFATDEEAYAEFERTVAEQGMQAFLDRGNVIPFPR